MLVDFLLKIFIDVGVDDSRISAGINLGLEFVILVDEAVEVVGEMLNLCHQFLLFFPEGGRLRILGFFVDLRGL